MLPRTISPIGIVNGGDLIVEVVETEYIANDIGEADFDLKGAQFRVRHKVFIDKSLVFNAVVFVFFSLYFSL